MQRLNLSKEKQIFLVFGLTFKIIQYTKHQVTRKRAMTLGVELHVTSKNCQKETDVHVISRSMQNISKLKKITTKGILNYQIIHTPLFFFSHFNSKVIIKKVKETNMISF